MTPCSAHQIKIKERAGFKEGIGKGIIQSRADVYGRVVGV
jgi:hypothetical protein